MDRDFAQMYAALPSLLAVLALIVSSVPGVHARPYPVGEAGDRDAYPRVQDKICMSVCHDYVHGMFNRCNVVGFSLHTYLVPPHDRRPSRLRGSLFRHQAQTPRLIPKMFNKSSPRILFHQLFVISEGAFQFMDPTKISGRRKVVMVSVVGTRSIICYSTFSCGLK